tara:strand:- start:600 stop:1583 length:984 start_codon:yes stop_codon:yes gene_type:complete
MWIHPKVTRLTKPLKTNKALIITGGGLCPGINVVISQLVKQLKMENKDILGSVNGYNGIVEGEFLNSNEFDYNINGSCLGMSREKYSTDLIANSLLKNGISQLYIIGGDGSLSVAHEVAKLVTNIQVIGIPKTIDNDIAIIDHSFGFYSAIDSTLETIQVAHTEAQCYKTVSIIESMGRNSGYLAAFAAASSNYIDLCIVPETLKDCEYYLKFVSNTMKSKQFCTIILSEGCNQTFKSLFLQNIKSKYKNSKLLVPGYIVRNGKLNSYDILYCKTLAYNAVKLAQKQCTDCAVGKVMNSYEAISLELIANKQKPLYLNDLIFDFINI